MKVDDNTYRILSAEHVRKQLLILFGRQVLKGFTFDDDIAALVGNHIIHLQNFDHISADVTKNQCRGSKGSFQAGIPASEKATPNAS